MSLLRDIEQATTEADVPLSVVLRKCAVLASRLGHEPLRAWVDRELNGYPDTDSLPPYRSFHATKVCGHFSGPFQSFLKNADIPEHAVTDEDHRKALWSVDFVGGVAEAEMLVSKADGNLQSPWPSAAVALYGEEMYESMVCIQAWRVVSSATMQGMLDTIRNKVLAFVLDIEKEAPQAGEAAPGSEPLPQERVSQIFNMTIYGGQNVLASGNRDVVQEVSQSYDLSTWGDLRLALLSLGVPESDLDDLQDAIDSDRDVVAQGEIGPATEQWLGKLTTKVAAGAVRFVSGASAGVIAGLVLKFIGGA